MGLDWIPIDIAKPGFEDERSKLRKRIKWNLPYFTARWKKRYHEIVIPAYACVGAPRVGIDPAADEWARARYAESAAKECTEDEFLQKMHGYYVLQLVKSPGLPQFTHGDLYAGVDATSYRGQFVMACQDLITDEIASRGYRSFTAEEAVDYGRLLLERAREAASQHGLDVATAAAAPDDDPVESLAGQVEIFRTAAEWFQFWGEKGHSIEPWA